LQGGGIQRHGEGKALFQKKLHLLGRIGAGLVLIGGYRKARA
jgi:hypothetical protein